MDAYGSPDRPSRALWVGVTIAIVVITLFVLVLSLELTGDVGD
jgi:hypothetical protein